MTTQDSRVTLSKRFFSGNARSYDRVVRLATLGLDVVWKRRLLANVPPSEAILDLACGTGIVTFALAQRFPGARIVGLDITEDYLKVARRKAADLGLEVPFIHGNAETAVFEETFDCITSSYLPKYVDPDTLLENLAPALRPGGVVVFHDFTCPTDPVACKIWLGYNRILNAVGRRLWPEWHDVFDNNLTELIVRTDWLRTYPPAFREHGYTDIRIERVTLDTGGVLFARKAASH